MTVKVCTGRLQKISYYLEDFPGPDLNTPFTKGDLDYILNKMVPAQWHRSMMSMHFQPFNKSMTKVIQYTEKLEVLEATIKHPSTKKGAKEGAEDKTEKYKS